MTHDERVNTGYDVACRGKSRSPSAFFTKFSHEQTTVDAIYDSQPRSATPNENLLAFAATVRVTEKGAFHDV